MVRLKDLPIYEQEHLLSKLLPPLGPLPWVINNKSLNKKKIAIITTAGLNYRNEENFNFVDASFRAIPTETESKNLLMTHSSCLLYTSPSPRDGLLSRMPSSA